VAKVILMKTLAEQVAQWRELTGTSQVELAKAMNVSQQAIQQLEQGRVKRPKYVLELLTYFAEKLPEARIYDAYPALKSLNKPIASEANNTLSYKVRDEAQAQSQLWSPQGQVIEKKDLPVYASATGGEGEVIVSYDPIEWVERPATLTQVKDAYAIYAVNDSMRPKVKQGDMLKVHPHRPARRFDLVVVVLRDAADTETGERRCLVKDFISRDSEKVVLRQYNPERDFDIPANEVESIHYVRDIQFS
jgi:phage repressor protein C with HTH and peptisase S24 domain